MNVNVTWKMTLLLVLLICLFDLFVTFSGSHPHVDPDLAGAWNYLFNGFKYWVIFPHGQFIFYRFHSLLKIKK